MAIPKPRKEGQSGGWIGHGHNKMASRARGGSPRAKSNKPSGLGGGGGNKNGCTFAPELWVLILVPLTIFGASGGLMWQALSGR